MIAGMTNNGRREKGLVLPYDKSFRDGHAKEGGGSKGCTVRERKGGGNSRTTKKGKIYISR